MEYKLETKCGTIKGNIENDVISFKGIRYGKANRFEYAKMIDKWDGVYDATKYGNCSWQPRAFYNEEENLKKIFYYNEFRKGETYTYCDDCLFLNIFKKDNNIKNMPVIVYIHGGGFTGGCGHEKHFDGPAWINEDVIGVTINYRLGPMGFIAMKELKDEAGHTGNYGLYDQVLALEWVKKNIEDYGGDPKNITIMGQSAGAMSVQQLCLSPLTKGLFNKAVMSSGGGASKMMTSANPEKYYDFWKKVMDDTGAKTLDEFKEIDASIIFASWQKLKAQIKGAGQACAPCIDNILITGNGIAHEIPYILGVNSHDIMPPILFKMANSYCAKQVKPSYVYFFDRKLPGDDCGAWHSADLWYWFGTLKNCWRPMEDKDYEISKDMVSYLTSFAKNGDPNYEGGVNWLPLTLKQKKVLKIGENKTHMGNVGYLKLIKTMLTNKAVGE